MRIIYIIILIWKLQKGQLFTNHLNKYIEIYIISNRFNVKINFHELSNFDKYLNIWKSL